MQYLAGMLLGGAGIGCDGGRVCKTAWHHPTGGDQGGRPRRNACKWSEV